MRKTFIFLSLITLTILAASALPLFGNSADEAIPEKAVTALAPVSEKPAAAAARSGCGGSCCSPSGTSAQAASKTAQIQSYLTDYYGKLVGSDLEVIVKDLGCHHEAEIRSGDEVITRLSINGGVITEIG